MPLKKLKKALDNPYVIFSYIWRQTYQRLVADRHSDLYKHVHFLDEKRTIAEILKHDRSMIRVGDGTFGYLMGASIYFNNWHFRYDKKFAAVLRSTLQQAEHAGIFLCFPHEQITMTKEEYHRANITNEWQIWISAKVLVKKLLRPGSTYGSSMCFHPRYNDHIDFPSIHAYLKRKHVYIITSGVERFKDIQLGQSTTFIAAPSNDAWKTYRELESTLLEKIDAQGHHKNEILIMISAAEAAKVMIYDLHKLGYTAWDTGQFFELASKQIAEHTA